MASDPRTLLSDTFGFSHFRPGQEEIVDRLMAGQHTLCVMPTGAGKSLCYQLPALALDRPAIIVSPLTALMDDQIAGLKANGVDAAVIHSGRDREDNVADWRRFASGQARLLYLSPERLMTERMLGAIAAVDPALFVIDEAHCISKWGASFRPEYEQLSALKTRFPDATLAAFTATADAATREDIARKLFDGRGEIFVQGFDRPNLSLAVAPKARWSEQLLAFLEPRRPVSGIVYRLSRKATEETADLLRQNGFNAMAYHAGLEADLRRERQEAFMAEEGVVMVATIAFGMGVDKPDIRYVVHCDLPGSMEAYYQEIGRAGRDGAAADTLLLYGGQDAAQRRRFIENDGEDPDHIRREHKRLDALLTYCEAVTCRRQTLLSYFGEGGGEPCGNCDVCLDPPVLIDGTREAQILFSAIHRTGQSFGAAHIIDVVRGAETEKIRARGHDALPTHGAGADKPKPFWQGLVRQMTAGGYLQLDIQRYGALVLTPAGQAVLRGEAGVQIREIKDRPAKPRKASRAAIAAAAGDVDPELLAALKALRRDFAAQKNAPAYVVFSDATLIDMARLRPESLEQMGMVNGVGPKKLADYGEAFLELLRERV